LSPVNCAGNLRLCDTRSTVEIESGLIPTIDVVFLVEFFNKSTVTTEESLWSVVLAIGLVVELNIIRINVQV